MNTKEKITFIVDWLKKKAADSKLLGFVVGVSGGVDSALTSTLCAMTGLQTVVVILPINQDDEDMSNAHEQVHYLTSSFDNVIPHYVDISSTYADLKHTLPSEALSGLSLANAKSRLRMVALYAFANAGKLLVVGTGNKVEDFGVGFFTKYGDGGVDISPIANLLKSEVRELAGYLGISQLIIKAAPTDGLWPDSRTDEDQLGATYDELEWAMNWHETAPRQADVTNPLSPRQIRVLRIYEERHAAAEHKLRLPPVCRLPRSTNGVTQ